LSPAHALPLNQINVVTSVIAMTTIEQGDSKKKPEDSPPGSPTKERHNKKVCGLKPTGSANQTKLHLFHAKEGIKPEDIFPNNLKSTPCAFSLFPKKEMNLALLFLPSSPIREMGYCQTR
jgi:hypothetical protein